MTPINLRAAEARALIDAGRCEVVRVMRPQPHSPLHENCVTGAWGQVWYTNDSVGDPTIEHWKDMPCPLPAPGAAVACREPWWLSDCGAYMAVRNREATGWHNCDVATLDGSKVWLGGSSEYRPKALALPRQTLGWSALPFATDAEHKRGCFTVSFADCNPDIELIPWSGNTIKQKYEATFRRLRAPVSMPAWAIRLHARVESRGAEVRSGKWCWVAWLVREEKP